MQVFYKTESFKRKALGSLWALLFAVAPAFGQQGGGHPEDFQLSVTAMETEEFALSLELWSPHLIDSGYFRFARFGALVGSHNYYEINDQNKKRHVDAHDVALGYQIGLDGGWLHLRSAFLGGISKHDRHARSGPDGPGGGVRDPQQFAYFETRHGFELVPPTHIASQASAPVVPNAVTAPQRSLFELGIGFRWNFIGSEKIYRAGDILIQEIQVFPYLAAHVFL